MMEEETEYHYSRDFVRDFLNTNLQLHELVKVLQKENQQLRLQLERAQEQEERHRRVSRRATKRKPSSSTQTPSLLKKDAGSQKKPETKEASTQTQPETKEASTQACVFPKVLPGTSGANKRSCLKRHFDEDKDDDDETTSNLKKKTKPTVDEDEEPPQEMISDSEMDEIWSIESIASSMIEPPPNEQDLSDFDGRPESVWSFDSDASSSETEQARGPINMYAVPVLRKRANIVRLMSDDENDSPDRKLFKRGGFRYYNLRNLKRHDYRPYY